MLTVTAPMKAHEFSRDEFYKMAELGWFEDRAVELLEGQVIEMPPQSNEHALAIKLGEDALNLAFGLLFWVRVQMPLDLTPRSTPNPDLAVIAGAPRTHRGRNNPTSALLVGEVSDSTLAQDRTYKSSLYAVAGIQEYWIINLVDRQLEIRRNIQPDPSAYYGVDYADVTILLPGGFASPLAAPTARVAVADLLP